ncbi:MAG: oligosaccharide flippase family protein [bacterium]
MLILANALQPIISFYLVITIGRKRGVDGLGTYSTIFNYVAIFQIVAAFGLRTLLTRDIAQNKENTHRYFVASSFISVLFAIISAGLMIFIVSIISNEALIIRGAIYISLSLIASALADAYEGIISGYEKLSQIGYIWVAENFLRVGISLYLIYQGFGIIALVWVYVIVRYLKSGYYIYYINRNFITSTGRFDWIITKNLIRQARTFALIVVCVTIYWKADIIMLEAMRSGEEVGFYSAAYRFLLFCLVLVDSFVNSLFPVISNYFKSCESNFEVAIKKSLQLLILTTVPIAVGLSLQAEKIIVLFYGTNFIQSVNVLKILIWTIIPYSISQVFAYALLASNNQRIDLTVNALSMISNILLNLLLIPKFGFMGATVATLISIHIYVALQLPFVLQKLIKIQLKVVLGGLVKIIAAALVMAYVIFLLRKINFVAVLPLSFLIYSISLFAFSVISKDDKEFIFRLMRRTV